MPVDAHNPAYDEILPDWTLMRDCHQGQRQIKSKGTTYLPATSGQVADGMQTNAPGLQAYTAYKLRANFPDFVNDAVDSFIGVMHHKPPLIELPAAMEPLLEKATVDGESLEMLLRKINEQQLITGRIGLLADVADDAPVGTLPYIASYSAEAILNWDDGNRDLTLQNLNMVSLDETEPKRLDNNSFEWEEVQRFRVLILGEAAENEPTGEGTYSVGVYENDTNGGGTLEFNPEIQVVPSVGGRTLNEIPFVFINATDVVPTPQEPPLLGLGNLSISVYMSEADYRQALFMQGQDTLIVIGNVIDEEEQLRVGANARIDLPIEGDAKYVGVDSKGLPEMRSALENDRSIAAEKANNLLDNRSTQRESGEALSIRVAAQTASLNQIVLAGAHGLELILKSIARWIGANEDEVVVVPNTDFATDTLDGRTVVEWMTARTMGAPISLESIHQNLVDNDLTEMTFDEEMKQIEEENENLGDNDDIGNAGAGPVDDDPNNDTLDGA